MFMEPMVAYWQESDLSNFDLEYAATLASKFFLDFTPTATADPTSETASPLTRSQVVSATSSVGPNSEEAVNSSNSGLSTGAKAGIGVGVAIRVILLGIAGFMLYKRRLRSNSKLDRHTAIQNEQPEFR